MTPVRCDGLLTTCCFTSSQLYQFSGAGKVDIACQVLVKALMAMPSSDFNLCYCLLPDALLSEATVTSLRSLSNLLESCDFAAFWEEAAKIEVTFFVSFNFLSGVLRLCFFEGHAQESSWI